MKGIGYGISILARPTLIRGYNLVKFIRADGTLEGISLVENVVLCTSELK